MPVTLEAASTVSPIVLTRQSDIPLPKQSKVYTLEELQKEFLCNEDASSDQVLERAGRAGYAFFVKNGMYHSFCPQLGETDDDRPIAPPAIADPTSHFQHLEFEPSAEDDDEAEDGSSFEEDGGETIEVNIELASTDELETPEANTPEEVNPLADIDLAFDPEELDDSLNF